MTRVWTARAGVVAAFLTASFAPALAADRPAITIRQGTLTGTQEGDLRVFKNIPFALPPVGERRWRPPEPAAPWKGVRDASAFGPSCIQPPQDPRSIYADNQDPMSEDCLSLNVWSPPGAKKAPVIVWIYGGALLHGSTANPIYNGAAFAKRGVVFVSINYRLGVLGWFAHPALAAESPHHASGNYGLLDQLAALHWMQDNVAAFGGDPANVTIMGESAGALSVSYLLTSPLAHGLFAKAISESANTRNVPVLDKPANGLPSAETIGTQLARAVGASDLKALRAMDAKALAAAGLKAKFVPQGTIDGWSLTRQVVETFDRGEQAQVPLLAGFNSGEVQSQRALLPPPPDAASYQSTIRARYGDLAPAFLKLYPAADVEGSMLATLRDAIYGWATVRMVRKQAAAGLPAYLYYWDHDYPAAAARGLKAFHASEVPFVFGQVGEQAPLRPQWPRPVGAGETSLSNALTDYWTSFARTGRPVAADQPAWPPYAQGDTYMHFAVKPEVAHDLLPGMFEMQEDLVSRRRAAGQPWAANVGIAAAPPVPPRSAADFTGK